MLDKSSAAIAALIVNRALCRGCIAAKTSMKGDAVDAAIVGLSRSAVKVHRYPNGTCVECGANRLVYAIDRPV
jgi:hypothetical protein